MTNTAAPQYRWGDQKRNPSLRVVGTEASADLQATLKAWALWQNAANLSERTITERAATMRLVFDAAGCGPMDLAPRHIIDFLTRPGLNNTSRATYHATIRAYCKYLLVTGQRADDPSLATPKPKRPKSVPRPIEPQQLQETLEMVATRRAHYKRTQMMLLLAAYAGLRVHEIAKIRGEDFDLDAGVLYVQGKGLKNATVPVHQRIMEHAHEFPRRGYWFPSYQNPGEPVVPRAVMKTIRLAMKGAGITATAHQLRHFYGTNLVRNGVDLRTVQELMRHENLSTTAIYTQVSDKQRRAGIDSLQ